MLASSCSCPKTGVSHSSGAARCPQPITAPLPALLLRAFLSFSFLLPSVCSRSREQFSGMPEAVIHPGTQLGQLTASSTRIRACTWLRQLPGGQAPAVTPGSGCATRLRLCRQAPAVPPGSGCAAACSYLLWAGGEKNPPVVKQVLFSQSSGSAQSPSTAPSPKRSTVRCQERHLGDPQRRIERQTTAFPPWRDAGGRERGTVEGCASESFFHSKKHAARRAENRLQEHADFICLLPGSYRSPY